MAHYRKIDVAIWNDSAFNSLKPVGKLAFFMLITHPNMTAIGAMRATVQGLAAEIGVSAKDFAELFSTKLALIDDKTNCVFVPNFLRYQTIDSPSPNVIKGWVKQSEFIPEGKLKTLAIANIVSFIEGKGDSFQKAFDDSFQKAYGKSFYKVPTVSFQKGCDDSFLEPVSSKQLAVSKPPYPAIPEAFITERVGAVPKIGPVDLETGEVSWAN